MAMELADMIPDSRLTIIPHAGHLVNIERPRDFNEAVSGFILGVRSRHTETAPRDASETGITERLLG